MFFAIMSATPDGRVAKYRSFETKPEADAHVERFNGQYPDAFVTPKLAENILDWKVTGASVAIEMRPPEPPRPEPEDLSGKITALEARMAALENRSNGVR